MPRWMRHWWSDWTRFEAAAVAAMLAVVIAGQVASGDTLCLATLWALGVLALWIVVR